MVDIALRTYRAWKALAHPSLEGPPTSLQLLRLLGGHLDLADHVESLLRQQVVLTGQDALEPADRVLERHVLALRAGERFGHVERLREEALDLARTRHD